MSEFAGATLAIKTGSEGPHYDPYSYTEVTVERLRREGRGQTIVLHLGLVEWLRLDGRPVYPAEGLSAIEVFEALTGLAYHRLQEIDQRLHGPFSKCPNCRTAKGLAYSSGFVGEELQHCTLCGNILWSADPTPYII